jgi:hypothetical protein
VWAATPEKSRTSIGDWYEDGAYAGTLYEIISKNLSFPARIMARFSRRFSMYL